MASEYTSPLVERVATREMCELWGPQRKFSTWRRCWPKTWKKASQKDFASASSRVSSRHSLEKAMARCLISFQESGISKF